MSTSTWTTRNDSCCYLPILSPLFFLLRCNNNNNTDCLSRVIRKGNAHYQLKAHNIINMTTTLQPEAGMQYAYCQANDGLSLAMQTSLPLDDNNGNDDDPRRRTCVVLLHGFSGSSAYFTRNYAGLAARHWVVAPDLRGHGASGRCAGGYHVARLAADLRTVLDFLRSCQSGGGKNKTKFIPVGCSLGAAVLWTYAELFGEDADVAGFVFADQAPLQDRSLVFGDWDSTRAHRGCYDEASMVAAQRAWASTEDKEEVYKGLVRECLGYRFAPEDADEVSGAQAAADEAFFTSISRRCDGAWLARLLADHTRYDHREAIEENVTKPTLVIAGRRTGCFPLEGIRETVRRVERGHDARWRRDQDHNRPAGLVARWSVYDSGHWMFYEEPDKFNKEIEEFVAECVKEGERVSERGQVGGVWSVRSSS